MLADVIQAKFSSNAKAAARLHQLWAKIEREHAREVSVQSLATKIGDLRRGKTEWWAKTKRQKLTRLFADLLGCDVEELLGRAIVPAGALLFPEFPGLPPLRRDEEPCRTDPRGGLLGLVVDGVQRGARMWITAGPGMGKSLVIRWLEAHAEEDCAASSVRTLAAASSLFGDPRPLVLEVAEVDFNADADALRVLTQRPGATVVLTPCRRPDAPREGSVWLAGPSAWEDSEAVFFLEARERLLRWIDHRLESSDGDTRLVLDDALDLLRRTDPLAQHFASPADLLALCADLHEYGVDSVTWEGRARRWLRAIGPGLLPADTPSSWVPLLDRAYDSLCAAAVLRREHAWGPLSAADWMALLPEELCGPEKERLGRAVIVENLRAAGLLRDAAGGLVLSPTWVREGLTGAVVDRQIDDATPESWGLYAADNSRQRLVDDALDRRGDAALCATIRAVVATSTRPTLGQVAAVEAAFAAGARRLDRREFSVPSADIDHWHRLVELQIGSMLRLDGVSWPFTRRGTKAGDVFLANSWSLSLKIPAPNVFSHDDLAWHFPGWFGELEIPATRGRWPWSGVDGGDLVRRMLTQSFDVLSRVSEIPADSDLPRVLVPAAIMLAPSRGWRLTPKTAGALLGSWEEWELVQLASARPEDERAAIADLLWEVVPFVHGAGGPAHVALRLARLKNVSKHLLPFILDNLSEASLIRTIERDGAQRDADQVGDLELLPRRLRRVVVQAVIADARIPGPAWARARALVGILDAEDVALVIEIIRESDDVHVARELAGLVWFWSPRQAREEAKRALVEGRPAAQAWFSRAPRLELGGLAALLDEAPRPLAEWVPGWARDRILDAGLAAEVLFALATSDGGEPVG